MLNIEQSRFASLVLFQTVRSLKWHCEQKGRDSCQVTDASTPWKLKLTGREYLFSAFEK